MDSMHERARLRGVDVKTLLMLEQFEAQIARDPRDAFAYAQMGHWWHWKRQYAKALEHYNTALDLDPNCVLALCARADLRATCPDGAYRNGQGAVSDATRALEIARSRGGPRQDRFCRMYLRVLAAAHAEAGDFSTAIEVESEGFAYTVSRLRGKEIQSRLSSYAAGQATRHPQGILGSGPNRNEV